MLLPIKRVSVTIHLEIHDFVKVIHTINKFTWTMAKFAIIFDDALINEGAYVANQSKLMSDLTTNENGKKCNQGVH